MQSSVGDVIFVLYDSNLCPLKFIPIRIGCGTLYRMLYLCLKIQVHSYICFLSMAAESLRYLHASRPAVYMIQRWGQIVIWAWLYNHLKWERVVWLCTPVFSLPHFPQLYSWSDAPIGAQWTGIFIMRTVTYLSTAAFSVSLVFPLRAISGVLWLYGQHIRDTMRRLWYKRSVCSHLYECTLARATRSAHYATYFNGLQL